MTNKERLEDIKHEYDFLGVIHRSEHIEWLIEQAERVEELENQLEHVQESSDYCNSMLVKREQLNKRYREAIDYVMKSEIIHYDSVEQLLADVKYVIEKTLEGEE